MRIHIKGMSHQSDFEKLLTDYSNESFNAGAYEFSPRESVFDNHSEYALILDRLSKAKEAVLAASCITRVSRNSDGLAFAVYLRDGQKITIGRDGTGSVWLRIDDQDRIRTALSSSVEAAQSPESLSGNNKVRCDTGGENQIVDEMKKDDHKIGRRLAFTQWMAEQEAKRS